MARDPRGTAFQPLIPRDVKLPTFDGSMGTEIKTFLSELHHLKCVYGVDDTQMIIYTRQLLTGNAKDWYRVEFARTQPANWTILQRKMEERFMPKLEDLLEEWENVSQKPGESARR